MTKWRAHQILQRAFKRSGAQKPPHQKNGGESQKRELRYMKTLKAGESLKINQRGDFRW